jgi:flagellar motor component MotA
MFAIIGILVVFGAVIGGFLMEKGNLLVLVQPAEILTIVGAALGTLLAANPAERSHRCNWRRKVSKTALPGHAEDDV